jgi:spectinomycin phosphotransferase
VRSPPTDLEPERLGEELTRVWDIRAASMGYVPEGGGSHHWRVLDDQGRRHFVTVDDLDDKDWLADTRDAAFEGLVRAFDTAGVLRREVGLVFVVAPVASPGGEVLCRVNSRYALSVFPYLEGHPYPFGPYPDARLRDRALDMVAALHRSTDAVRDRAPRHVIGYGGQRDLHAFLLHPGRPWTGGPFSEPARDLLSRHGRDMADLVAGFDHLVERTAAARGNVVITHGEPHPANLIAAEGRLHLVDWDTVGLAPPERDLSLIVTAHRDHPVPAPLVPRRPGQRGPPLSESARRERRHPSVVGGSGRSTVAAADVVGPPALGPDRASRPPWTSPNNLISL